jgi:hypothetical protein
MPPNPHDDDLLDLDDDLVIEDDEILDEVDEDELLEEFGL